MFALLCILLVLTGGIQGDSICSDQLSDGILHILGNCSACQRTYWGIIVEQLLPTNNTWDTIFALNSDQYLLPASNNKILTTSAAFYELGPDYTITTPVYVSPQGDVCFVGQGDPTITVADLESLAVSLYEFLPQVQNIYVDNSYYDGPSLSENWDWGDITAYYGAQACPIIVEEGAIGIQLSPSATVGQPIYYNFTFPSDADIVNIIVLANTTETGSAVDIDLYIEAAQPNTAIITGSLPAGIAPINISFAALDPITRFNSLWGYVLGRAGVVIKGGISEQSCGSTAVAENWKQIGELTSPPLSEMLNWTLLVSDNLYAETFLRHLGKTVSTTIPMSTAEAGILKVFWTVTQEFGVDNTSFRQDDGSGLSRQNLVSPQALIDVIAYDYFSMPNGSLYLSFFPTAGETGTLYRRFVGTPAQGILHAKTGTLNGVYSLSGFVDHQDSEHPILIFSIIANNAETPLEYIIDEIGVLLASVKNC